MREATAFLGLGSNLGDRRSQLARARDAISDVATIKRASSIYETEPVDFTDQPWFLNQALMVGCTVSPFDLLKAALAIERRLGRVPAGPKGPRAIDIDILLYDDIVMDQERDGLRLIIPHPRMHRRRFVLTPLCEMDASQRHPLLGQTMEELLARVDDGARVIRS